MCNLISLAVQQVKYKPGTPKCWQDGGDLIHIRLHVPTSQKRSSRNISLLLNQHEVMNNLFIIFFSYDPATHRVEHLLLKRNSLIMLLLLN